MTREQRQRRYVFCGERPSARALAIGATWRNGRLSGYTLHRALRAHGIDPLAQRFVNVFLCDSGELSRFAVWRIRRLMADGLAVVALGQKVARALESQGIPHTRMYHPAARGRVRKVERYILHVGEMLGVAEVATDNDLDGVPF